MAMAINLQYQLKRNGVTIGVTKHSYERCQLRNIDLFPLVNKIIDNLSEVKNYPDKAEFAVVVGKIVAIACYYKKFNQINIVTCIGDGKRNVFVKDVYASLV